MRTFIVFNDYVPFRGFIALTVFPFIFVRNDAGAKYGNVVNNHEFIHVRQQVEMLAVGLIMTIVAILLGIGVCSALFIPVYFWWYAAEWIYGIISGRDSMDAYRSISFEREAYANQEDMEYLSSRKFFAWTEYIKK